VGAGGYSWNRELSWNEKPVFVVRDLRAACEGDGSSVSSSPSSSSTRKSSSSSSSSSRGEEGTEDSGASTWTPGLPARGGSSSSSDFFGFQVIGSGGSGASSIMGDSFLAGGAFAGVGEGKSGFCGDAGVVEISCNLTCCSSVLIGVAGGFELDSPIVEAKLSPNIELPVEAAGLGKSSLADPSPLKVEPTLNPFVGIRKGFGLGACGVGVASSLSRLDPSAASLISDTWVDVFEANEELPCPNAEPG
jgi:hypothetical protein